MLNHTYTSVKNANVVDCGKKKPIPSQPFPLLRDNYLGEYRTELDKKKVLANLGIATDLSLEWEFIKGDIGRSEALMKELNSRTKYISALDGFEKSIIEGVQYLETVVGEEEEAEEIQNSRLTDLETLSEDLITAIDTLKNYIETTVDVNIKTLTDNLNGITEKVNNITELIKVSTKEGNALTFISDSETQGLYVPDLSSELTLASTDIKSLQENVTNILNNYVTKDDLGGDGSFDFVDLDDFDSYVTNTNSTLNTIQTELGNTVKTNEEGHVTILNVNLISNNTNEQNVIKITDSFEMTEGIPLDVRFVVPTRNDLSKLKLSVCYAGMGVIVRDESSLYILREPKDGKLTLEFIENIDVNWKCPEDLVTQALSREEYEELLKVDPTTGKNKINPHKFYYIFEEDTTEPKRSDYTSDESYLEAYNAWLKILSQEYMSAAWGVEIEAKVAEKADNVTVNKLGKLVSGLQDQIDAISGGDSDNSISKLAERLTETESDLEYLLGKEGNDEEPSTEGKISEIETSISTLELNVANTYVSIESITNESDNNTDYIFVKKTDYDLDKDNHKNAIATEVVTKKITTPEIYLHNNEEDSRSITLTSDGTDLFINNSEVALVLEVPIIIETTLEQYDEWVASGQINEKAYYYTNSTESYVTKTEFSSKNEYVNKLLTGISTKLGTLTNLHTPSKDNLVNAINDAYLKTSDFVDNYEPTDLTGYVQIVQLKTINGVSLIKNGEETNIEIKAGLSDEEKAELVTKTEASQTYLPIGDYLTEHQSLEHLATIESLQTVESTIPIIEIVSLEKYDSDSESGNIKDSIYYYVFDSKDRCILESEFKSYKTALDSTIRTLNTYSLNIGTLVNTINNQLGDLSQLINPELETTQTLMLIIKNLQEKVSELETKLSGL